MGLCDLCLAVAISKHAPRISSWPSEVAVEYVARMRFSCIQRSSSASDHAPWGCARGSEAATPQGWQREINGPQRQATRGLQKLNISSRAHARPRQTGLSYLCLSKC